MKSSLNMARFFFREIDFVENHQAVFNFLHAKLNCITKIAVLRFNDETLFPDGRTGVGALLCDPTTIFPASTNINQKSSY